MIALTLREIADLTGGDVRESDAHVVISAPASIDSRSVAHGALFVAIAGEHVDGHAYAAQAVRDGAAGVLCSRVLDVPCVVVPDPVLALGRIAAHARGRLSDCVVVAITGSQGKTSAKDLLAQLLARLGETVATLGNLNNEIGVPLTILRATEGTRYLVVEMGARNIGNITYLCEIARPTIGVVLNVGTAHVGEFGSRENIAVAKGELVESLPKGGTAVLNADDPLVLAMAGRTRADVTTFGTADGASLRLLDVQVAATGEPDFVLSTGGEDVEVHVPLLGEHQAYNAAAAAAVALTQHMALAAVAAALGAVEPLSSWRMERHVRDDGVVVINDAYNANPDSMTAALRTLARLAEASTGRSVAVLGEMLELGDAARAAHEAVGTLAAGLAITQMVVVGAGASGIHDAAVRAGAAVVTVADGEGAIAWLEGQVRPGDIVLVKASRATGLERVASALLAPTGNTARDVRRTRDEGNDAR